MLRHGISGAGLVGLAILAATLFLIWHTFAPQYQTSLLTTGRGPVFFPRILLGVMVFFSLVVIVQARPGDGAGLAPDGRTLLRVLAAIALVGAYVFAISLVGFVIASLVFASLLPPIMGYTRTQVVLPLAAVYTLAVWYVFEKVFLIILPSSPWFDLF